MGEHMIDEHMIVSNKGTLSQGEGAMEEAHDDFLVYTNAPSEEEFFPWITCPVCSTEGLMRIDPWTNEELGMTVYVASCRYCGTIFDPATVKVPVTWVSHEFLKQRGVL